ncbi:MAG: hypothetical protein IT381_14145 [Deltaproteobacteria bacterium]|nr:hypothetical protein [Deltaproteobacteria bacterium]
MKGQAQLMASARSEGDRAAGSTDAWSTPQRFYDLLNEEFSFFVCERCAVWRPKQEVTFLSARTALMHAVDCHPHKLIDVLTRMVLLPRTTNLLLEWTLDDSAREKGSQ